MSPKKINVGTNATSSSIPQRERVNLFRKKPGQKLIRSSSKSQSAMEYLMTYGWSILIIAVVLVAMWQLGIIGGTAQGPRATAGACQVVRNAAGVSLAGQCNNEVPQYVAQFSSWAQVNSTLPAARWSNGVTSSAWFNLAGASGTWQRVTGKGIDSNEVYAIYITPSLTNVDMEFDSGGSVTCQPSPTVQIQTNKWYFAAVTGNSNGMEIYINGQLVCSRGGFNILDNGADVNIGSLPYAGYQFDGSIANVQLYNTSLSAAEIHALYNEGIGGAPVSPAYIVGWWPLNGNAQDYSGNQNNGVPANNVAYTGAWASGYAQP